MFDVLMSVKLLFAGGGSGVDMELGSGVGKAAGLSNQALSSVLKPCAWANE